ncbi:MAG: membrane dipeptidase [Polyangiaceae bacterium]|nr:membrane dipeptidase [Polyangiaceae bacterium]
MDVRTPILTAILATMTLTMVSHAAPEEPAFAVVDLHVDVPWQVHFKGRDPKLLEGHATTANLRTGAYGGLVFPIYLPDYLNKTGPRIEDADAILLTIENIIGTAGVFLPPGKPAETGKVNSFISIEGAGAFASDITQIDRFIARGVRLIGPVHAHNNRLASSATGDDSDFGFTEVGFQFVERVYKAGALIDVSHLSDKAFFELVPIAKKYNAPIVATHSNSRKIANHPRNLTDDELKVIGETGGVAGLNFHTPFVVTKRSATMDDVIKQVEHMVKVAGIDHVAIGSDFDGGIKPAEGLEDASMLPSLARRLRKRGMSEEDVLKIFSLNALRVLGYRNPAQLQAQVDEALSTKHP